MRVAAADEWGWGSGLIEVNDPTLAWEGPPGTIQQGLTGAVGTLPDRPFRFHLLGVQSGSDACWGGAQPFIKVDIGDRGWETRELEGCPDFLACGEPINQETFERMVPSTEATVRVQAQLWDDDWFLCGGKDDKELTLDLTIDNVSGAALNYQGNCQESSDGWGMCWAVEPNGRQRICASWQTQWADSNLGEDFYSDADSIQEVPASFAKAAYRITKVSGGVTSQYATAAGEPVVLDADGCIHPDQMPYRDQLMLDQNGSLEIELRYRPEFCYQPADGGGCLDDAGNVTGTRAVVRNRDNLIEESCVIWTTDPTRVAPDCLVLTAAAGAFANWTAPDAAGMRSPPGTISMMDRESFDSVTRIAAGYSHILRRHHATGDMGLHPNHQYQIRADRFCGPLLNGEWATCSGGLGPNVLCPSGSLQDCLGPAPDGGDQPTYTSCEADNPDCLVGTSYFKYVIAHELGHSVEGSHTGSIGNDYYFDNRPVGGGESDSDPAGVSELCQCSHVLADNTAHCLQSLERTSAAVTEAYAQLYSMKAWNDQSEADCAFSHGKEFLDPTECRSLEGPSGCQPYGGNIRSAPPIQIDCATPLKWRNRHCLDVGTVESDPVAHMATEVDWAEFLYAVNTGPEAETLVQTYDVIRGACTGWTENAQNGELQPTGMCGGSNRVGWEGEESIRESALRRANGELVDAAYQRWLLLGAAYGVSTDVSP